MPGTSSETIEQFKKALRSLFRRRKSVIPTNAPVNVAKSSQAPARPQRPQRPRSASAVAAPEVFLSPNAPAWPIFGQLPPAGFYCSPVELPAELGPILQHRSKSDAGRQPTISDLFSELDATSIRRLSLVEDGDEGEEYVPELDVLEIVANAQSYAELESPYQEEPETELEEQLEQPEEVEEQSPEVQLDAEEEEADQTADNQVEPADIPIPDESGSETQSISTASEHTLARNDSANGNTEIIKDDSSSFYSTDSSFDDADSATDNATVSTPRTASMTRTDLPEYFDEKIPVMSEPPQVMSVTPAPGMAATSGPLDDFPFH